ncbi:hypothetical protein [Rhodanobacter hydrolyticus]|uniref:Lipoprotein n=1 Tax=Rhodanobacter hydrolyticus TaxID=2250595 RepID=A0ABW8J3W2_9GAMM
MKRLSMLVALAAMVSLALIAGCATKPPSPAQIAAVACPSINAGVTLLKTFNAEMAAVPSSAGFATKAQADLTKYAPTIDAVCAAGATVTATNLSALKTQALPALGSIVGALPLTAAQQMQAQTILVAAETAMGLVGVVEQQIAAAKAAPVSASSAANP